MKEALQTAIRWLRRLEKEYPGCLNDDAIDKHLTHALEKPKVYLVLYILVGHSEVMACFSTKEKAHEWLAETKPVTIGMYEIREIEVQ